MAIIKGVARKEELDPKYSDGRESRVELSKVYVWISSCKSSLSPENIDTASITFKQASYWAKDIQKMLLVTPACATHKKSILPIFDAGMLGGEDSLWLWPNRGGGGAKQPPNVFSGACIFQKKLAVWTVKIYRIRKSASVHFRERDILSWASAVMQIIELHLRHLQRHTIFSNAYQGSQP